MAGNGRERDDLAQCACGNEGSIPGGRINMMRVREKLDWLEDAGRIAEAERLLSYWLEEARQNGDHVGEILVENEFVGLYRKNGPGEKALTHGERAMTALSAWGLEDTVMAGTTRINLATACSALGRQEQAMGLFAQARALYEAHLSPEDGRMGGLYNNMGLCATALGRWEEGRALFARALAVMERVPDGEGEMAITCLNLADLVSAEAEGQEDEDSLIRAAEETEALVDRAWALLNTPTLPRDAADRFLCGKCAPVMAYYGRLEEARQLRERAGEDPAGEDKGKA